MKYINKYKSSNYDSRNNFDIKFIIIHYTALSSYRYAISFLCKKSNKVSSHFLISQTGGIYLLVNEKYRAWHAGIAKWSKIKNINSCSIGIELDYSPNNKNNNFSKKMISSLIKLIHYLKLKYKINSTHILGHSDVSPYRKIDPGPKFPWHLLNKHNLTFKIKHVDKEYLITVKKWFNSHSIKSNKNISIFILGYIGYDTKKALTSKYHHNLLLKAYLTRYLKLKKNTRMDKLTINFMLKHFINFILTKN